MKKLVCIISCLISYNLCADSLLEAIRARDVQTVTHLLTSNSFSPNYYDAYMTAVQDSVDIAHEQMLLQRLFPVSDKNYDSLYLCSLIASIGGFTWAATCNKHELALFFMLLPFIATPLIIKGTTLVTCHVQQQYNDAVQIQDLILTAFADLA